MMHEKWRNNLLLMASLTVVTSTGFATGHIEASGQTTSSFTKLPAILKSSWVATLSLGPVWESAGNTQTFYLAPNIEKTYAANHASHALVDGEFFLGIQKSIREKLEGQIGLAVATTGNASLSGNIWDDADALFNNYTYHYQVRHTHLALKGKLLADRGYSVTPWVSGSLGVGFNQAHDFSNTPTISEAVVMSNFASNTTTAFTYNLGAGVQRHLNQHWQVGIGYEFADWGRSQLNRASGQSLNSGLSLSSNDTTLTASVSTLGLSVYDPYTNDLTGNSRTITITNTGSNSAMNVTYSPSPALPNGTTISPESCGTIVAYNTCMLTITPGKTESATAGNTSPTPITLSISGENTNTLTPTVNILTYGSVYQGGYIYAVDDTTPNTGSIGGTVVTQTDQAPDGVVWSSNGAGSAQAIVSYDIIPGIGENSTTTNSDPIYVDAQTSFNTTYSNTSTFPFPSGSFSSCDGRTNGACNSANILTFYKAFVTNYGIGSSPYALSAGPTTTSYYAAGRCTATISGYSDWYLPAICEMGPDSGGSGCSASTQDIVSQLPDLLGDPLAGDPSTSCKYGANCLVGLAGRDPPSSPSLLPPTLTLS